MWSHDFCLACDRQIAEGAYCSQACRLADLEPSGASEPSSPSWPAFSAQSLAPRPAHPAAIGPGLCLPPAVDFSAYRSRLSSTEAAPSPARSVSSEAGSICARGRALYGANETGPRCLSLSPSRLSLSSLTSCLPTGPILSDQAANYLRCYADSFDRTRGLKRRLIQA